MTDTVERLAIELRQIDAEDASHGHPAATRKRNWGGASDWLKDEYRKQARRILRVIAAGTQSGPVAEKLVRDLVPQIIRASGQEPVVRTAGRCEYLHLLGEKLAEEVAEYLASGDPAELADVAEVLAALAAEIGLDLDHERAVKARARGVFGQRLVWSGNREVGGDA